MKKEYNIARGKPSKEQLDLSNEMVLKPIDSFISEEGIDIRNYGSLEGLKEARKLLADLVNTDYQNVIVYGSSSLNIMFDLISHSFIHGVLGNEPWCKLDKIKWLCPVPGYDRHYKILEYFNIEMINVPLLEDGPDMDVVEELIKDKEVKGIWCVPKYSNPTGCIYSNKTLKRLVSMKPAAKDFRIYYDNAYSVHDLYEEIEIPDIIALAKENGNPNIVYEFMSTSKITFAGSGLAGLATSPDNFEDIKKSLSYRIIGHNKINQIHHVKFLKDINHIKVHMKKHAEILRPKFLAVEEIFNSRIVKYASWSKPKGGYFITLYVDGLAKEVIEECKNRGLTLTEAGCAFPYHHDPSNSVIRIAPSFLDLEELKEAINILCDVIIDLNK